ncbi:TetR family transcriptional regulator C-terminal domain-containing protein [Sporosarcina thermotolerans]|uniref:TetR family transcriptional regulator C-terminal domain-containing protein n=1 Tax=Sporosarcina thermotolerans TaxID=633404 RepID=A0AAW9A9I4_9BACL|nr:TetR/AcrR family transcriptional regulator [Sporosarcina thermotolerans]MDW0116839.1 TetR family transcriptional regulator C-terminal domain-containing protein [Sporosarcina thermotolerans]WHT49012.1 TetR family transcriptional regulator C-terminal domain-containing protein [Sporosarcina thermotolerans]
MSRRYDSEEAKRIIREKAFELFSLKGYNQTSVGDIAKASGCSKGHIYYHFENKEKLFVLLAQNSMHQWYTKWMENESNYSSATEKWYGMANHVLYNYQTPLLKAGQELGANPTSSPESVQKLYELAVVPMSTYRSIFLEGIERGEFENGNVDEWTALLGTWLGGLCQLTNTQPLQSLEPLFEQAITIFLSSIKERGK